MSLHARRAERVLVRPSKTWIAGRRTPQARRAVMRRLSGARPRRITWRP